MEVISPGMSVSIHQSLEKRMGRVLSKKRAVSKIQTFQGTLAGIAWILNPVPALFLRWASTPPNLRAGIGIPFGSPRMSWFVNLGQNSNSNHFITCLLIFILHYSPQLLSSVLNPWNRWSGNCHGFQYGEPHWSS